MNDYNNVIEMGDPQRSLPLPNASNGNAINSQVVSSTAESTATKRRKNLIIIFL